MGALDYASPRHITEGIGLRLKERRLARNWSRETLAARSGVAASAIKRLENEGTGQLMELVKLAITLGSADEFATLFPPAEPKTLAEMMAPERKRGRT